MTADPDPAYARAIDTLHLDPREYADFVTDPDLGPRIAGTDGLALVVVEGDARDNLADPGSLPLVVCWLGEQLGGLGPPEADLVVSVGELDTVTSVVSAQPEASIALALLLRQSVLLPTELALAAESAVYSMLQGSAGFDRWRGTTRPTMQHDDEPTVTVDRHADTLVVRLNRPHRHNAITRQLRDELCSALSVALIDTSITSVQLSGAGPSFCSGGDLAEFGARSDPARAHVTRLAQSPARLVHRLRDRVTAQVHGATLGGGLEMATFARRVRAHPDTRFGLPEVALGLIPGAGGTVSISRRIGRQRTAALALAVETLDATTALGWGLVDEIDGAVRS